MMGMTGKLLQGYNKDSVGNACEALETVPGAKGTLSR